MVVVLTGPVVVAVDVEAGWVDQALFAWRQHFHGGRASWQMGHVAVIHLAAGGPSRALASGPTLGSMDSERRQFELLWLAGALCVLLYGGGLSAYQPLYSPRPSPRKHGLACRAPPLFP